MATTRVVSYSELDTFRQCPLKHQLAYKERWATEDEPEALGRGTLFHSVMEAHYEALRDEKTAEEVYAAVSWHLRDPMTGEQSERQALVEWIYVGYCELYGRDEDWKVEAIEMPLEVWLPNAKGNRSSFKLAGTVDLVVRDMSAGGGLWIVDHKTCKNLPRQKDFDMEDQTALYTYLLRRSGMDIRGAIYNHCRTEKLKTREMGFDERFKRTITVRGERELEKMALEALDAMQEAYRPREGDARRHPDGERCGWKCSFTEPCLAARKGADLGVMMGEFGFKQMNHKPGPTFQNRAKAGKTDN